MPLNGYYGNMFDCSMWCLSCFLDIVQMVCILISPPLRLQIVSHNEAFHHSFTLGHPSSTYKMEKQISAASIFCESSCIFNRIIYVRRYTHTSPFLDYPQAGSKDHPVSRQSQSREASRRLTSTRACRTSYKTRQWQWQCQYWQPCTPCWRSRGYS